MLYINYLTFPLVTVTGVLLLGAWYVARAEQREDHRRAFAAAFGAGGLILAVTGFHLTFTWPIPAQYNIAFGEPLAYFGTLLVIGSVALSRGVGLGPVSVLGALGGVTNLVVATAIFRYRLTSITMTATMMFGASGLAAVLFPFRSGSRLVRSSVAVLLLIAGALFGVTACGAYLHHLAPGSFDRWIPAQARGASAARE
ncbi:hypothetical protein BE17_48260 [Sorangium cellulosum]|uniref:DUF981 domain-containing protein n=1 Tax=Sorangium cellulosum TaxID=56 RepID=A0A150SIX7_SORCE|nr:hypothetical protein BE17_48260 [Sorangium cellulosum]